MGTEVLEKLKQLPPEKQQEVDDFISFLLGKYSVEKLLPADIAEKRKQNMGWAKEKIWMADDFNNTPNEFKDYI